MKIDEKTYLTLKDKIEDYSDESLEYIKDVLSTNIELSHTILQLVRTREKPFALSQYTSLIKLLLQNKTLSGEVFSVFFSKSNFNIENAILFIKFIGGETYRKILELEDRIDVYNSIAYAFSTCKNDDRRYLVIDSSNTQLLKVIKSFNTIFSPEIEDIIYIVNISSPQDFFKEVNSLTNDVEERRQISNLWWSSFVCREQLFTLTMGILREEYESLKVGFAKENDRKSSIYYADYTTKLLRDFFVEFMQKQDLVKLDEIATFCLLYFNLDQDILPIGYLAPANDEIYNILIDFMLLNPENHLENLINEHKKLRFQRAWKRTVPYNGAESSGGGLSRAGDEFTLSDSPIVEKVLAPFLSKLYENDCEKPQDNKFLKILEHRMLSDFETKPSNPILLKRAAIPPLILGLLTLPSGKKEFFEEWLINIIKQTEGIPTCSESVFSNLMRLKTHINKFPENLDHVFNLIAEDIKLNDQMFPTNVFAIQAILFLIRNGYKNAKSLFLEMVKNDEYIKRDDWHYNTFSNLGNLDDYESSFVLQVIHSFLGNEEWISSGRGLNINEIVPFLVGLYLKGDDEARQIKSHIIEMSRQGSKIEANQNLGTNFLSILAERDPEEAYLLLYEILGNRTPWEVFEESRDDLVSIADHIIAKAASVEDAKTKEALLDKACVLIEQFIEDPDPVIGGDGPASDYHTEIKNGENPMIITSVRGRICWAVQKLCLHDYTLQKAWKYTGKLLDDSNLYVVNQAIVPFIEVVKRRNKFPPSDQEAIKIKAMYCLEKYSQYKAIANTLAHVFTYYRDIDEEGALKVLKHLKQSDQIGFFFSYFAYFRSDQFQDKGTFDSSPIKGKITSLIKDGTEPYIVRDIFSHLNQVVQENVDFLPRIIDPIKEYEHNIMLDKYVLNQVFRIVHQIIEKDKAKKYYSDAISIYKKYIAIEKAFIDESFYKPETRESDIYWVDYYHKSILQDIYLISKSDFYSCVTELCQIDFKKKVYFDHSSIAKIVKDEQELGFLPKAIKCITTIADFDPQFFEIKNQLESRFRDPDLTELN